MLMKLVSAEIALLQLLVIIITDLDRVPFNFWASQVL